MHAGVVVTAHYELSTLHSNIRSELSEFIDSIAEPLHTLLIIAINSHEQDYIDILGGVGSVSWQQFQSLFLSGFRAVQRHINDIAALVQVLKTAVL
jgi:hypothetical protein